MSQNIKKDETKLAISYYLGDCSYNVYSRLGNFN